MTEKRIDRTSFDTSDGDRWQQGFALLQQWFGAYLQTPTAEDKSAPPQTESPTEPWLQPAPLARLGDLFQLSLFERLILLLCVALELEPQVQNLCAQAHGNPSQAFATLGLALVVLPEPHLSVLSTRSPLQRWHLIQPESAVVMSQAALKIDRRILCFLLGEPEEDAVLAGLVKFLPVSSTPLPPCHQAIADRLATTWTTTPADRPLPLIALTGNDPAIATEIARAACDRLGLQMAAVPATLLPTDPQELHLFISHWEREAPLTESALLLDCELASSHESGREGAIALVLETLRSPTIVVSRDRRPPLRRSVVSLEVPRLPHSERVALWQAHLGTLPELNGTAAILASQFQLSPTAIQTVCQQAIAIPLDAPDSETDLGDRLWNLCCHQVRPHLDDIAQRVETAAIWDDLVLPERQRQILEDIASHLQYRSRVYQDWGFARQGDRGLGLSALFAGESGTGKTLAAEVLANICCLDLYRIDLSATVSKYIGETEKNLRRIFDAAETGSAILLFDEADALFGKRTEVSDSHDRYANLEVSYLLQRMEAYQGLAILTTNLKDNLDPAFLRRLRFIVQFPFPDATARTEIWQRSFPLQTPTRGLDFDRLGQLKIAGGNIRNIALNAAFLAARGDRPITMQHLRQAAERDYHKREKLLTTTELQGWAIGT